MEKLVDVVKEQLDLDGSYEGTKGFPLFPLQQIEKRMQDSFGYDRVFAPEVRRYLHRTISSSFKGIFNSTEVYGGITSFFAAERRKHMITALLATPADPSLYAALNENEFNEREFGAFVLAEKGSAFFYYKPQNAENPILLSDDIHPMLAKSEDSVRDTIHRTVDAFFLDAWKVAPHEQLEPLYKITKLVLHSYAKRINLTKEI